MLTDEFIPDWASPPGTTIKDILSERGQTISDLAQTIGESIDFTSQLLEGAEYLTEEIANRLSSGLGFSALFWMRRETQYRESLNRLSEEWLEIIPFNDLAKLDWVKPARKRQEKIAACLEFFGVHSIIAWRQRYENSNMLAAFRTSKSFQSNEGAVMAWLRKGEIEAEKIVCAKWDPKLFRASLGDIRKLTRVKDPNAFLPELRKICAESGVAIVVQKTPSGCRASGATRFLTPQKALLMLSFRHLSDDHFWFTFFHEAGHLLLHNMSGTFLEGDKETYRRPEEAEANNFAADILVPPEHREAMKQLPVNGRAVMRFAKGIGISPGIVVGQLHHIGAIKHWQLNNLRVFYKWTNE